MKLPTQHFFRKQTLHLGIQKNPGNNVVTTLNVGLSKAASNALGSKRGAVVVMDPETGKVLAMVSKPS